MAVAFIFPGQGSQAVGMGKALADAFLPARAVFDEVDAALGENLTRIIWEGPAQTLTLTENAQPALMAVSLAAMRVLEAEAGVSLARVAKFVAGHSLGEYSALAAAVAPCRRRFRSAPAPWRRSSGSTSTRRSRSPPRPPVRRSVRPPTTTAADRWSSPATRPPSSAPSRSPRAGARGAP